MTAGLTEVTPDEVVTAWVKSLPYWDSDVIESDFDDPSTGTRFTFTIRRAESDSAGTRARTLIRARGRAYRLLAEAHGPEYEAILAGVLADIGGDR